MKKIATLLVALTVVFAFAQSTIRIKLPGYKKGQLVVDPNHLATKTEEVKLEEIIRTAPIPTVVVLLASLPASDQRKYSAGDVLDTLAKNYKLGEYSKSPSLVILVTPRRGNPALRWSISTNQAYDAKMKKANDEGYHTFADYISKTTLGRGSTTGHILTEAVIEALAKEVIPALR
jgi:hypothetical protein